MIRFRIVTLLFLLLAVWSRGNAQVNTDQVLRIGQNAIYFEDYMLAIQYFNQVIAAKPYLAQPYFLRSVAKLNLDDFKGAEDDASLAIERHPYDADYYELRGVARQNQGDMKGAVEDYANFLKIRPENKNILYNQAMAQIEIGDTAAAHKSYTALVKAHPSYDNGYIGRARLFMVEGDTLSAMNDLDKAIELNPNAANAYLLRSNIAITSSKPDYKKAADDLDKAIKLQPQNAGLFINRAFVRYHLDDYFGAMADYDYATQLDPLNTVAIYNRGLMRAELKDNDRAIQDFTAVLKLAPNDVRALYNRALLYYQTGQYNKALADLAKVEEAQPDFPTVHVLRYEMFNKMGNTRQAKKAYDRSMAIYRKFREEKGANASVDDAMKLNVETELKEDVAARFSTLLMVDNSSDALEQQYNNSNIRGKVQDRKVTVDVEPMFALSYYYSPTELQPSTYYLKEVDDVNATRILRQLLLVTNSEANLNDENEIARHFVDIDNYNSYISARKPRAIDYFGRAMAQFTLKNYSAAIADLNKVIEITPDFSLAWFQRGVARCRGLNAGQVDKNLPADVAAKMDRQEYLQSIADFDKANELSPSNALALYNKGCVLVEMQDYTSAIAAFSQAIATKPDFGEAYYNRAYVYLKLGNKNAGIADLSKAGELGILPSYNLLKRISR